MINLITLLQLLPQKLHGRFTSAPKLNRIVDRKRLNSIIACADIICILQQISTVLRLPEEQIRKHGLEKCIANHFFMWAVQGFRPQRNIDMHAVIIHTAAIIFEWLVPHHYKFSLFER